MKFKLLEPRRAADFEMPNPYKNAGGTVFDAAVQAMRASAVMAGTWVDEQGMYVVGYSKTDDAPETIAAVYTKDGYEAMQKRGDVSQAETILGTNRAMRYRR